MNGWTIRYTVKRATLDGIESWQVWQTITHGGNLVESQSIFVESTREGAITMARIFAEAYVIGPDGKTDGDNPQY